MRRLESLDEAGASLTAVIPAGSNVEPGAEGREQPRQAARGARPATRVDQQQAGVLVDVQGRVVDDVLGDDDATLLAGRIAGWPWLCRSST